jgi:hypothetical protein
MGLFRWLEDKIDKRTPKIEVDGLTNTKFDTDSFKLLMSKVQSEPYFRLRSSTDNGFILNVIGNSIGSAEQANVLFGKEPTAEMYKNMKSRFEITLLEDGRLKINSFEHLASMEKERDSFRNMLKMRLDVFINSIDSGYVT